MPSKHPLTGSGLSDCLLLSHLSFKKREKVKRKGKKERKEGREEGRRKGSLRKEKRKEGREKGKEGGKKEEIKKIRVKKSSPQSEKETILARFNTLSTCCFPSPTKKILKQIKFHIV